ncbi:cupin domain-containing protein [Roseateles chitosanitabidus]|uniref:cupin domain-containing protein n=1 Tax=Roseateles chitosanitabidus TaxID=65048 RepID=UPI000830960E|nr:cupin domain-containing protein [Roseateles chitosanitabidus]MBO9688767.1 cupin domain-containing protein [Roseateles chitosanitabidus]
MALPHAAPAQPIDVAPLGAALGSTQSSALFKSAGLEVMRLVLPAGKVFPAHKVDGEITLHCLEGTLELSVHADGQERRQRLGAGQLCYLEGGVTHAVTGLTDASALVTIVLRR